MVGLGQGQAVRLEGLEQECNSWETEFTCLEVKKVATVSELESQRGLVESGSGRSRAQVGSGSSRIGVGSDRGKVGSGSVVKKSD